MAKNSKRINVKMVSTENNGFYYTMNTNTVNNGKKLVLKRYDPVARKHVEFKEAKIK